ncbi:MAG: hypothetical protein M3081_09690 [Gemmatimonadota bacterium]|nr:hypothetical protein [Gemmatimonadota bacterium]
MPTTSVVLASDIIGPETAEAIPRTREDSQRLASMRGADEANARVDTIVAPVTEIRLRVGESMPFMISNRPVGRDRAGQVIYGFVPLYRMIPERMIRFGDAEITAVAAGDGVLIITPVRFSAEAKARPARVETRIPVHITP